MRHIRVFLPLLIIPLIANSLVAQTAQSDPSLLTLDTLLTYRAKALGPIQWQADGKGYLKLEPSPTNKDVSEIIRYDAASGERTTLVTTEKLTPKGAAPLVIEEFNLSDSGQKLLIFTNSARVWRSNTRGDYWVLDLNSWQLTKLGGDVKPASLMFAKFSPDATRVGYVRNNNVYVENLANGGVTQLTSDGSKHLVNGTFDWVYEEELFCRDGFRWSPDGKQIAYWQLNSEGVKEFSLINDTAGLYPV